MKLTARLLALGLSALISTAPAMAQDWAPKGPLTINIGFGAGGSTDTMGRVLAKVMQDNTGWPIVVENKPGGGGVAMFTGISQRPADGRTVGMGVSIPVLVQLVQRGDQLPFDVDSFDYLGTVARTELAVVAGKDAPFDDLAGMVSYAKEQGNLPVAAMAPPQVLLLKQTMAKTGAELNIVNADGAAEVLKLILGGQVMVGFAAGEQFPYLESGDMKVIGSAGPEPLSYAPEAKNFSEIGVEAYVDPVYFLAMRAGTAPAAVEAIAAAIDEAVKSPEVAEIVKNATQSQSLNLGPEGTHKMMTDGPAASKVLFGK